MPVEPVPQPVPAPQSPLQQAVSATQLPDELAAKALAWPARLDKAKTSPEELCAVVRDAGPLADELGTPLMARRDAVWDKPEEDEPYRSAVEVLDQQMVGMYLAVGAETFYAGASYRELASLPSDPPSRALLQAAHDVLRESYPVWLEQTWDLGGCGAPAKAQAPVEALAAAWAAAPACLQAAVRAPLEASLADMAHNSCFCEDEPSVRAAYEALDVPLGALESAGGPAKVEPAPVGEPRYSDSCAG